METKIQNLLNMRHFFNIVQSTEHTIKYTLKKPSQLLLKNVYKNWLQSICAKTHKTIPVYLNKSPNDIKRPDLLCYGFIKHKEPDKDEHIVLEHKLCKHVPENQELLQFDLIVPQQDIMQFFIQWQRYRKYWWSSITTTPSLFAINDITYKDNTAHVDVIAQLSCGQPAVETVTIKSNEMDPKYSCLTCAMHLKSALFILLLDGLSTNSNYLRLHRKMAPFQISFALDVKDSQHKDTLIELATMLHNKLRSLKISTLLPAFSLTFEDQIKENLHIGVPYTAIVNPGTIDDGTFDLLNSSTMMKERVHVADFHSYAELIC